MVARIKVTLSGSLGTGGVEKWSTGFHLGGPVTPISNSEANDIAVAIRGAISTGWAASDYSQLQALLSTAGTLERVDVYGYGASGPATSIGTSAFTPVLTGTGAPDSPPQCCAVYSLLTDLPGSRHRGRMYWPAVNLDLGPTFKSAIAQAGAGAMAQLLTDAASFANAIVPVTLVVYSAANDGLTAVSGVRGGDVIDTQRRRRDSLVEAYTIADFPAS